MKFKKPIKPEINSEEFIKFRMLFSHYNKINNNIAIVGDDKKYNDYIKIILRKYKHKKQNEDFKIIQGKNTLRIFDDSEEINYIHIKTIYDLDGLYFNRFE